MRSNLDYILPQSLHRCLQYLVVLIRGITLVGRMHLKMLAMELSFIAHSSSYVFAAYLPHLSSSNISIFGWYFRWRHETIIKFPEFHHWKEILTTLIRINGGLLSLKISDTICNHIWINIYPFVLTKMHLKMPPSTNWQPFGSDHHVRKYGR